MSDPKTQNEASVPSGQTAGGALPDLENCRARAMGQIQDFAECLMAEPYGCAYACCFGYSYLCWHPRHQEIAERSLRAKPSGSGEPTT